MIHDERQPVFVVAHGGAPAPFSHWQRVGVRGQHSIFSKLLSGRAGAAEPLLLAEHYTTEDAPLPILLLGLHDAEIAGHDVQRELLPVVLKVFALPAAVHLLPGEPLVMRA